MNKNESITLQELVEHMPICHLTNTDESPFWYHTNYDGPASADYRYKHEAGRVGDMFWDGNNGDKWRVVAIDTAHKRAVIWNMTQDGRRLVYWD